ncbi:MerC domain-containing protein [Fodinibius sp.]|uniref:MerC domain-containing protein n=1 Tax=Fodinibius sp. TaxID=1872440 RepID=UPI003A0FC834
MFSKSFWDRIGISLSGLCAVHCLFFPVAVALLPLWPVAQSVHSWTHPILFLLITPTVYFVVRSGNVPARVSGLLFTGLAIIGVTWLLHDSMGMWIESAVTTMGSLLLIAGHWFNYKIHSARTCSVSRVSKSK